MRLELGNIFIKDIIFGDATRVENGVLSIKKEEMLAVIGRDDRLKKVDLYLVHPGDSIRIMPVKDVYEPRVKVAGGGTVFPGWLGDKAEMVGSGVTHVLKGAAVLTVGKICGFQEGIVDMSGPGARFTPFSQTHNIVVYGDPVEGLHQYEHEAAIRLLGLKAARYVAEAGRRAQPDETRVYETKELMEQAREYPNLPKVAYVYMLQSQGLMHDTYLYGVDVKQILPTFLYPTEVMDGAIVSGNCVSACDKNTTYHHQNSPVIYDLYERHGKDYNFMGVVCTNENVTLLDKERSSNFTAKLVEFLGADAVIISEEGFGNPDADLVMNCRKIAAKGIKTVLVTDEYAGRDGASQSLADSHPSGDAVVTGGNANEVILLPPMEKVIGYPEVANVIAGGFAGSLRPDGSIMAEIQVITGATNELGFNKMGAASY